MSRTILRSALGAAALAVVLAGCGAATTTTPAAPVSTATSAASATSTTSPPASSSTTTSTTSSTSASTSAPTSPTAAAVISIKDFMFTVPASVPAGASITVTNNDAEAHTVTSKDGGFDVKVAGRGGTAQLTAPAKAGTYRLTCDFHANMAGALVVA